MGRPSALTEKQWAEIQSRILAGEPVRVLAREYGVSDTALHKRLSLQVKLIKDVAQHVVAADAMFAALPVSLQVPTRSLIEDLKGISLHLAGAAKFGAATSHRLAGIANAQVAKIDDSNPMESQEVLQGISALTKMANEAGAMGMGLIAANKDTAKRMAESDAPGITLIKRIIIDVKP